VPTYLTPGVYYERADSGNVGIAPLRTDIAGFVGIARRGPIGVALPVESWRQFVTTFGDFTGTGFLAYSVRAFFENGGKRCWVVRVASSAAAQASTPVKFQTTPPTVGWEVEASTPGVWGNDLDVEWRETHRAQTTAQAEASTPEYLTVDSIAGFERGTHVRVFGVAGAPQYRAVSDVDPSRNRLYWINPRVAQRLPYEARLIGYDETRKIVIESIEYTLLVRERGQLTGVIERLSLVPAHQRYGPNVLAPLALPADGWLARPSARPSASLDRRDLRVADQPAAVTIAERRDSNAIAQLLPLAPETPSLRPLEGGLDGLAALSVRDFVGEPAEVMDGADVKRAKQRGLRALELVSEVAVVAVPDILIHPVQLRNKAPLPPCQVDECLPAPPPPPATPRQSIVGDLPPVFTEEQVFTVQQALVEHCESLHDRFAIIDPPFDAVAQAQQTTRSNLRAAPNVTPLRAWRRRFDSDCAALYAPWLLVPDPLLLDATGLRAVPPSGHVAGFIAQTDLKSGVHRAPANGALGWVQAPTFSVDDSLHAVLNPEHVNVIRSFAARGLRIFGARTLSSNPDWRFVNVRRLLLMIEKAIRLGTQWATFEPNNHVTRAKVHLALTSLLLAIWQRGGLAGATAKEAFYVRCGETENPADQRALGILLAEVGVAPSTPFEFVVVRVGVSDGALEVTETGAIEAVA